MGITFKGIPVTRQTNAPGRADSIAGTQRLPSTVLSNLEVRTISQVRLGKDGLSKVLQIQVPPDAVGVSIFGQGSRRQQLPGECAEISFRHGDREQWIKTARRGPDAQPQPSPTSGQAELMFPNRSVDVIARAT
jgi:hypothetical protein